MSGEPPPKISTGAEAVALRSVLYLLDRALEELPDDSEERPYLGVSAIRIRSALAEWDAQRAKETR